MSTYKCISCGATKNSDKTCQCSVCGYKMFETPYNRAELLKEEVRNYLSQLKYTEVQQNLFEIFRFVTKKTDGAEVSEKIYKSKDDARFPDFKKIQKFVCSSTKTEEFHKRLSTTTDEIRKYISTSYSQEYQVSFEAIRKNAEERDGVLKAALKSIGTDVDIPRVYLPEIHLEYSETPVEELLVIANDLLDYLDKLNDKIYKFIKQNNLYGTAYQRKPKSAYKITEETDYSTDLRKGIARLYGALEKNYVVDIFSDGTEELYEMLKALWYAIEVIMTVPMFRKNYLYVLEDDTVALNDEINEIIAERLLIRYADVVKIIVGLDFLADKTEDELFEIYNKMIDSDIYGFMGINKSHLLKIGESEKKLESLIGLSDIKESIKKIKAYALTNRDSKDLNVHMCFLGNPGTGKTEVARCIADILYENKILPTNKVVEVDRSGLVSEYFGATAEKTRRVIDSAMGGVLFVDEAYALGNNSSINGTDYGKEAIDILVKAMEDNRGKLCVIFAGYRNEMLQMLKVNPGFKSRIQFTLDFPNYSRAELGSIMQLMLNGRGYSITEAAAEKVLDITDIKRKEPNFANAREIRNILDQVIMWQNMRCIGTEDRELGIIDVNKYIQDSKINLPIKNEGNERKILTAEEELEQLVGLDSVKRMVKKIKAYAKRNKGASGFNLHMCFYGNPGTGKTEVARIISGILYDAGVLAEAKMVETDGQGLLGKFVGETAPKTEAKINEAMNGLLFIDEAYSLVNSNMIGGNASYGEEAISVLLKEMEDHRGQFCVILAGYKNEMKNLLSSNPGFESRIQFTLDFPDYTREELGEIARKFIGKNGYKITDDALNLILDIAEYYRRQPNFANARTIRNIIDQVLMNQNLRTEDTDENDLIILSDVEDYLSDEGIDITRSSSGAQRIGFI